MIDHLTLRVPDFEASKAFYLKALAPLGYVAIMDFGPFVGMGAGGKPDFWLAGEEEKHPARKGFHLAFRAKNHAEVDAFHKAALAAGAKDDGAPGPRKDYHPNYYGAFVISPDGNHVEACCHDPE
jgi:catechol 2,3-dioxygenase-like lactoylglutathione lyase family enzyme